MKLSIALLFTLFSIAQLQAQLIDSLNTAKNEKYMKPQEIEMIYEINRVRSNPKSYIPYIEPLLVEKKAMLKKYGKGEKNYSVSSLVELINGKETRKTDTVWHYMREEEVKALSTLISDLKKLKPLSVLKPDSGVYKAAQKHAADQEKHKWTLLHTGTDGSHPWDRIRKFSPGMSFGNENIAGRFPEVSAREIVLQLLIDTGIPGYGHRYNLLNPQWTHVGCVGSGLHQGMYRWIQNFGMKKPN